MPTNQLAPPDMPWLTGSVASAPNPLGPPLLNYAAPPSDTTQGAGVAAAGQQAWQWLQDQRAESVRQGLLDPNTGLPTQAGLVQGLGQTAQGVMMGTTAPGDVPPPGIVAYHGSPHSFDQFDTSKIGTGEGAQAYGHGLYFAGNEGVAQQYKEALGQPAVQIGDQKIVPERGKSRGHRPGASGDRFRQSVFRAICGGVSVPFEGARSNAGDANKHSPEHNAGCHR